MDQNHAPPSPLQQHRPSSRHANQGSSGSSSSTNVTDNKLKNPVGLHRPNTSCTSPTVSPTGLGPWPGAQEASSSTSASAASPSSSSSMTWQESEEAAVERWRARAHASSSSSTTSSSSSSSTYTQPLASTSRCPSPHHVPMDMTVPQSNSPQPYGTSSSSSLLTSEPLNRTVSANPSPTLQAPQPSPSRKKRVRAASLPNATPIFKRHKSKHDTPTPSDAWQRTYESGDTSPTKIERQKAAAAEFGRVLRSNRNVRAAATREQHCLVACRQPAINVNSLRTLDASEILKNPQLRHDLLFDSLAFRPVNLPYEVPTKPGYAEIVTGGKTPVVDPRASSFVADMYWDSIAEEIATGCRCVRWKMPKNQSKPSSGITEKFERIPECLCGRWRRDLNETEWWTRITVWPTRIPELIKTLREILISLMGSTTPCPNHFAHSFSREALEAHEAVCPTVTHALVPELYAALDPEFLTLQVRRGVFDLQLFDKLGEAMKVHCAPVRDEMVDDMVRTALSGDVAKGLRKCFDCAEIMKLDIANHQVHALRPYLWDNANQHEFIAFQNMLTSANVPITQSKTRRWINVASRQVLSSSVPHYRPHLIGRCICKNNMELVHRSLVGGFLDLVFADWTPEPSSWPPLVQRRAMGANGIPVLEAPVRSPVDVPESLKMDSRRIRDFNAECIDISVTNIILRAAKDKLLGTHGVRKVNSEAMMSNFLSRTRADIEWTMDKLASPAKSADAPASSSSSYDVDQQTRSGLLSDLGYRLALRVLRPAPAETHIHTNTEDMQAIGRMAQGFTDLLSVVVLTGVLLGYRINPTSTFYDVNAGKCLKRNNSISTATAALSMDPSTEEDDLIGSAVDWTGPRSAAREVRERHDAYVVEQEQEKSVLLNTLNLESVAEPLRDMTERMIKIIAFNLSVFRDVYAGPGMMIGS
ncbi:hypothetical protein I317_07340 [Kwoniella heveanensis CBS 569]|nr:hypothetical protein I317_07340 [Kwoniella heveanensis CBS 569]